MARPFPFRFKREDHVIYEDELGAVELLNGSNGPTIVVYDKCGCATRKLPLAKLLEDEHGQVTATKDNRGS